MNLSVIISMIFIVNIAFAGENAGMIPSGASEGFNGDCPGEIRLPQVNEGDLTALMGKTKWGHLTTASGVKNWLIQQKPGSTIYFCGRYKGDSNKDAALNAASLAVKTAKIWATSIKRAADLTIKTGCPKDVKASDIMINIHMADTTAQKVCKKNNIAGAAAYAEPHRKRLIFCKASFGFFSGTTLEKVMLHEMGHLWGLCDQYDLAQTNCDRGYEGRKDRNAVMGGPTRTALTSDDIKGMRKLTCRDFSRYTGTFDRRTRRRTPGHNANKDWENKVGKFSECR